MSLGSGASRTARQRRTGHALLSVLVGALVLGLGAVVTIRWTLWLLLTERLATQRRVATLALQSALELGSSSAIGEAGPPSEGAMASRQVSMPDGTALLIRESRTRAEDGRDPGRGAHVTWTATWVDPWGHEQTLVLRTYWVMTPRIY